MLFVKLQINCVKNYLIIKNLRYYNNFLWKDIAVAPGQVELKGSSYPCKGLQSPLEWWVMPASAEWACLNKENGDGLSPVYFLASFQTLTTPSSQP